ncbi:MAG: ral secretion pathway protein [Parcubacteria group bacterium]|nr:ral secretion pathway protein [Parcubacteria group bacterium]
MSKAVTRLRALYAGMVGTRLSMKEHMFLIQRLSFLLGAGIPLHAALSMLREQGGSARLTRVLEELTSEIANGRALARGMTHFPHVFGEFEINMVRIGESSGTLARNLSCLALELKKRANLRARVVGAFIYPAVIALATLAITGFLMLYLFPRIMPIFLSLHMKLPLTTRVVIALSGFLMHWGIVLLVLAALSVVATSYLLHQSARARALRDKTALRMPVMGALLRQYYLADATRTLGLLLQSGVPITTALSLTADTTRHSVYKSAYQELAHAVERGERISVPAARYPQLFPAVFVQMLAVGETSGTLIETCGYLSELHENDVEEFTKNLSSLVEPALMIVMGLIVGFIAISIISPIYGITQNLHP